MGVIITLVVPNSADLLMLSYILNRSTLLRLFTNNLTPGKTTVIGDITEASGSGYNNLSLSGGSWTIATADGTNSGTYAQQTFTLTGAITVYGYYLTTTSNQLLFAERFDTAPYVLPSDGGEILVNPKFNLN